MRLIRATGAVAEAMRRYDPELDVRYSWERRQWAIVYRTRRPDLIPPPVKNIHTEGGWLEELLPEKSEAYISYRTKTYPAGYVRRLGWSAYERLIQSDTMLRGSVRKQLQKLKDEREIEQRRQSQERWKEARTFINWHARTHPMAEC